MTITKTQDTPRLACDAQNSLILSRLNAVNDKISKLSMVLKTSSVFGAVGLSLAALVVGVPVVTASLLAISCIALYSFGEYLVTTLGSLNIGSSFGLGDLYEPLLDEVHSEEAKAILSNARLGLANPACNCFMNAVLQMIFSNRPLASSFMASLDHVAESPEFEPMNTTHEFNYNFKKFDPTTGKFINQAVSLGDAAILKGAYQDRLKATVISQGLDETDKNALCEAILRGLSGDRFEMPDSHLAPFFISLSLKDAAHLARQILRKWNPSFSTEGSPMTAFESKILRLCLVKLFGKKAQAEVFLPEISSYNFDHRRHSNDTPKFNCRKDDLDFFIPKGAAEAAYERGVILEKTAEGGFLRVLDLSMKPLEMTKEQFEEGFAKSSLKVNYYAEQDSSSHLLHHGKTCLILKNEAGKSIVAFEQGRTIEVPHKEPITSIPSLTDDNEITISFRQQEDSSAFYMQLLDGLSQLNPVLKEQLIRIKTKRSGGLQNQKPQINHFSEARIEVRKTQRNLEEGYYFDDADNFSAYADNVSQEDGAITTSKITLPRSLVFSCSHLDVDNYESGKKLGNKFFFTSQNDLDIILAGIGTNAAGGHYKLQSFTVHRGPHTKSGHFFEYQRHIDLLGKEYWICHDDSQRRLVSKNEVMQILNGKAGTVTANTFLFTQV